MSQPINHLGTPTLLGLPGQNVVTDLPVKQNQLTVDRQRAPLLSAVDALWALSRST